jgi:hypothetical protein
MKFFKKKLHTSQFQTFIYLQINYSIESSPHKQT